MSTNEELSSEIVALKLLVEELKSIIRSAMGAPSVTPRQQIASLTDGSVRNTARLHLKALWTKMATDDKDVISGRLLPILESATDAEYMEWSGGLPKNWAATYDSGRIDPYLHLYVKSKEDTYENRDKVKAGKV